jgi:GT2 family glycosyltransferase
MQTELSIVIVNWNSMSYLRECLQSLYQTAQGVGFEIIVVDNASAQRDVVNLPREFPQVVLIQSQKNIGFAGANNLGFTRSTSPILLFLNPDTQIVGPAIAKMLEQYKALPDAGILGCKLLNSDGSVQTSCIQKFPTILNQATDIEYLRLRWPSCPLWELDALFSDIPKPVKVEVISGACMMVRRDIFQQVGMFSEDYFMYAEDLDLCYKVQHAGHSNYYTGDAVVIHHGGKSTGQQEVNEWATQMKFKAIIKFCRKTRGAMYSQLFRLSLGITALLRLLFVALAYPFANTLRLRSVFSKWRTILKLVVGVDKPVLKTATDS